MYLHTYLIMWLWNQLWWAMTGIYNSTYRILNKLIEILYLQQIGDLNDKFNLLMIIIKNRYWFRYAQEK